MRAVLMQDEVPAWHRAKINGHQSFRCPWCICSSKFDGEASLLWQAVQDAMLRRREEEDALVDFARF